ncbi:MAG: tetratricopeptide repeat protein, partial [Rhizobacter sp.]|nr:tetratricopeptide repeat protein [Rhizobacter sp.]
LDAIVAKALRKVPSDRYDSAEAMGADLGRWQRGWPVEARHAGAGYRVGRFVQRHRAMVAATAAIALALSTGLGVALWQAEHARQEARVSNSVQAFLVQLFDASDPEQARGRDVSAKELLDRGAKRLDTELQDQPAVLAQLHHKIGDIYVQLGSNVQGRPHLEKALVIYRSLGQEGSERAIDAEFSLGELLNEDLQFDLARQSMTRCLRLADEHYGTHNRWRLPVHRVLAWSDLEQGHAQAAVDRLTAALAEAERDGHPLDYQMVSARGNLANAHLVLGQYAIARDEFVAVLKDAATVGEELTSIMADRYNLARTRYNLGEVEVAAAELEVLVPEMDRHIGPQHDRTIKARSLWAQALAENGEFVRAVKVQRVNLTAVRARPASDEDVLRLQEMTLAKLLKMTMQPREGLPLARSALAFMDVKYVDPTWLTEAARRITAELLMENGELDEAMRMLDVAMERSSRIDNHQGSTVFADLLQARATALRLRAQPGDAQMALALLDEAQAIYAQALGPGARATLRCAAYRAWIEAQAGSASAAQRFFQAAAAYEATLPPTHLARAELELMRADLGRREVPAGTMHAQTSAREHAGRAGWKTALGIEFKPPLLGLH